MSAGTSLLLIQSKEHQGPAKDKRDETASSGAAGVPLLLILHQHTLSCRPLHPSPLFPLNPVNTHFFLALTSTFLPLSITWPLRVVAMVTPPTGASYLLCYRSNWFPTEFQPRHSVSRSFLSHERVPIYLVWLSIRSRLLRIESQTKP